MNYQTMTSKQLSQALTEAKIKGRFKATTKAQKIELLIDWEDSQEIRKLMRRYNNSRRVQKMAEEYIKRNAA